MIEFDDEVKHILGIPNFVCGGIAGRLREKGFEIECKSEPEQAEVLYWMLTMYEKHRENWKSECDKFLQEEPDAN